MLMDQNTFISDSDAALTQLIWSCIENDPAAKAIISSQEQILFSSPKTAGTKGTSKLSLFLYNIIEETAQKNISLPSDNSTKKSPLMSFALSYLVTPITGNDKDDHTLLEKIIQLILTNPLISNATDENNVALRVKIDSLSLDELSKLWIALGTPFRLSVSLTLSSTEPQNESQAKHTSAAITPQQIERDTKHVTQLYQVVLNTFTEQSRGWMNRNMVFRQLVLQNFKKNTEMTVDEMLFALNNLGNKLGQHESAVQFTVPLNKLAKFYESQLDQLKGMQKVSRNQKENIETIDTWIKDIKALVEELEK